MTGRTQGDTEPRQRPDRAAPAGTSPLRQRLPIVLGAATGVLVCAVVLAAVLLLGRRASPPDTAAQALCTALQTQDYAATYNDLSGALQEQGTQAQFIASQRELDIVSGSARVCGYSVQHNDGTVATVLFTITRQTSGARQATARFVHDGDTWRLGYYDATVI
ncbi:MAG: hypothetical protein ACRDHE_16735 [Ktedonobacterales bacterium]